jgi:transposase-like protein
MLGALLRGVSTREYQEVLPQMAEAVGVSCSAISRKAVEASAEQIKRLQERRWESVEILAWTQLRAAIEEVFGGDQPVQRCRNHKLRNVVDELPKEQQGQALNLMRAAWKVKTAEEGEKRLEQLARFLERNQESAARSLREGMKEMFTLQRLKIPESLPNAWRPPTLSKAHRAGSSAARTTSRAGATPTWCSGGSH